MGWKFLSQLLLKGLFSFPLYLWVVVVALVKVLGSKIWKKRKYNWNLKFRRAQHSEFLARITTSKVLNKCCWLIDYSLGEVLSFGWLEPFQSLNSALPLAMFESFCFLCKLPFLWNNEAHLLGHASIYRYVCPQLSVWFVPWSTCVSTCTFNRVILACLYVCFCG